MLPFSCLTSWGMEAASLYARDLQESSLETVKMDVIWQSSSMSVRMDQNSAWMLLVLDSFVGILFPSFALENHQTSSYFWRKCLKYSTLTYRRILCPLMVNLEFCQWPFINLHYPTAGQGYAKSGSYFRIGFCTFFLHLCEVGATLAQASDIPVLGGMFHVVIVKASHVLVPAKSHPPPWNWNHTFWFNQTSSRMVGKKPTQRKNQVVPEALMLPLPGGFRLHQKVVALYELLLNSEMKVPLGSMDGNPWGVGIGGENGKETSFSFAKIGVEGYGKMCAYLLYIYVYIYIYIYCPIV